MSGHEQSVSKPRRGAPLGNKHAKRAAVIRHCLGDVLREDKREQLYAGLRAIYRSAGKGDLKCMEFIRDSLDGKPAQQVEVTGQDGGPVMAWPTFTKEEWLRAFAPQHVPVTLDGEAVEVRAE
jgi:hypothetical protein